MNKSGLTFIQYDRCKVWAKIVEKDKVPVQIIIQWPPSVSELLFEAFRCSPWVVSPLLLYPTYQCRQQTSVSQLLYDSTFLTGRGKKALTSPISSFFHSPSHQTDCKSLIDSCRFLPLTPIFRSTCWYPVTEAEQTKKKSRWRSIINTQKLLFIKITNMIWTEHHL